MRVCVLQCVCVFMCALVCVCMRARVCVCVCMYVYLVLCFHIRFLCVFFVYCCSLLLFNFGTVLRFSWRGSAQLNLRHELKDF